MALAEGASCTVRAEGRDCLGGSPPSAGLLAWLGGMGQQPPQDSPGRWAASSGAARTDGGPGSRPGFRTAAGRR